jgi:hypothetical protein
VELIDRYLNAVRFWLPRKQAADVVAELSADLRGEVEEREQALGRALTVAEQEAILSRWGHPMLVAGRYQPQEFLVGPTLLPAYRFVLKLLALVYVLPWFLAWIWFAAFDPAWRQAHPDLVDSLQPLFFNALFLFALTTALFGMTERAQRRNRTLETWTPRQLVASHAVKDWRAISPVSSMIDLGIQLAVLAWWVSLVRAPASFDLENAIRVTWAPLQSGFYWAIVALMSASIGLSCANLLRPRWTSGRLRLQALLGAAGAVLVALLLPWSLADAGAADPSSKAAVAALWINRAWTIALVVTLAIAIVRTIQAVWRSRSVHTEARG